MSPSVEGNTKASSAKKYITILSMDGGGVRGIIPAVQLQFLEHQIQILENNKDARIADYFDILAGTSQGGSSSAILTVPNEQGRPKYSADDLVDFNMNKWREIFPPISDPNLKELKWVKCLVGPEFSYETFYKIMEDMLLPDTRLTDTLTNVVITSFDITKMQPVIFSTYEAKKNPKDNALLKDVATATCSDPQAWSAYYFENQDPADGAVIQYNLIDGYVVADNPTWVGVTEALKEYTEEQGTKTPETLCKLLVLSLGCGSIAVAPNLTAKNTSKWGTIQWLYSMQNRCRPYSDIFQAAATNLADIQLDIFLKAIGCTDHYLRIQKTDLSPDLAATDDSSEENMIKLSQVAHELLKEKEAELKEFAKKLVEEKHLRESGNFA